MSQGEGDRPAITTPHGGDPIWRHKEAVNQTYEGRANVELVVRMAATIGNYDYLFDWTFTDAGEIEVRVGATGIDAFKGVKAARMSDPTAAADTTHGTLVAPNLVAANHDHYFNFRIDFDVDQPVNHFGTMDIVPAEVAPDARRRSLWKVEETMPHSELEARYKLSAMQPRVFHISNPDREGYLGHTPGWMIHHGATWYW